jgi:hypothetical protein
MKYALQHETGLKPCGNKAIIDEIKSHDNGTFLIYINIAMTRPTCHNKWLTSNLI